MCRISVGFKQDIKKKSREIIYFWTYLCVGWCACSFGYLVDKMHLWDISIYTDKGEELGLRARVLSWNGML